MLLTEFEDRVALLVPSASPPLIQDAIRQALAHFCQLSTAWRQRSTSVRLVADRAEYDISGLAEGAVCAITDLRMASTQAEIKSTTEADLNRLVPGWQLASGITPLNYLAPSRPDLIRVYPIPTEGGERLDIEVAMYPSRDATEIPEWIGQMYFDDIVDGACGKLYAMRGQTWSDPRAAKGAMDDLVELSRRARVRVEKSNTRTPTHAITTSFEEL